ncbi:epidermal growth factor receptor kinase substrate 8-like protein 3b [Eucyclogobius newberryi]|uniref:epidermal growth factor receptor kinase substrate 8-like protein 3b n=1 Tax=Eucyclogobius newberryi TaxID=166745 RepID=UPI003B59358F
MFGSSPFSYAPGGLFPEDLSPRRSFHNEDQRVSPLQRNNMSRPSGKSIYMQRREYSETLNKQSDSLNVRVEHLFTCDLDGQDVNSIEDCVAKLKRLDIKGRLWSQEMILDLQGGYLVLSDIETKSELDSLVLSNIINTNAILDTCAYNSLLTLTIQERNKRIPQVYMFQCEETGAEVIKADLDKAILKGGQGFVEPRTQRPAETTDLRSNLENIIGAHVSGGFHPEGPRAMLREQFSISPEPPQWSNREPENYVPQEAVYQEELYDTQLGQGPPPLSDTERNIEIFNHVLGDLEIFMQEVAAAMNTAPQPEKKKKKSKKSKANKTASLPIMERYVSSLQKIKYGFNLLGQLEEDLTDPSAEDYVHIMFNILTMLVNAYPPDVPPSVMAPLLTDAAVQLLGSVVTPEEEQLWGSLGDYWMAPRSQWREEDIPQYIPQFDDNWQPPPPTQMSRPVSRSNSQRFPSRQQNGRGTPLPSSREPEQMQAVSDFTARNNRELSLMKWDVVEVVQRNKQWWLVRNNRNEEGHVPQNVLEPLDQPQMVQREAPVTLLMSSSSAQVSAWLSYKGFSKMTVRSLGVLNGRQLLGMSKEEIRSVCPEDGGKVFFQLQAVKSAIALASEPSGPYNGRY